jgi:hypothetical protein
MNTAYDNSHNKETYTLEKASGNHVAAGTSNRITENLIFVVDFANISLDKNDDSVTGKLQLKHTYTSGSEKRDIMDYVTEETKNETKNDDTQSTQYNYKRSNPAISNRFSVDPVKDGIEDFGINVASSSGAGTSSSSGSAVCYEKDTLTAKITIDLDKSVTNTQYDERKYSVLLKLKKDGQYVAFPEGTAFLFQGDYLEANADNTSVSVPVKRSGTYQMQIKTALFGYDYGEYKLEAELYSSSEPHYYNSIDTTHDAKDTFTVVHAPTYALSVTAVGSGASQIVTAGGSLDIIVRASHISGGNSDGTTLGSDSILDESVAVKLYQYQSGSTSSGTYTPVSTDTVFETAVSKVSANANDGVEWKPVIREGAAPGTYRLEFTIGDKVEYLDFIVQ